MNLSSKCLFACHDEHKNNEAKVKKDSVKGILLKVRWNRKADWQAVESPKKQTDEFDFFAVKGKKANKPDSFVPFFGKS